ncbi:hypothetical protein [Henriciella pelagia]|jgi:hypothetical protein|uniref:Uncharacterized protein n=1 Tax=Henriciella pelagia TaxID=1977912 RepID=A0ABQ1JZ06_9PROT|nr:hypothetical protein [Henriciella pelagia]GGB78027.1 hypothetical protein GCM10011503_28510 [Henriciella pelagia]
MRARRAFEVIGDGSIADSPADTLTRPDALVGLADAEPEAAGRWELHLAYRMKSMNTVIDFKAVVDFVRIGAFFSGRSSMAYLNGTTEIMRVPTDIEGELTGTQALLDVHMQEGALKRAPFHCSGEARPDGRQYEGLWTMPCIDPVKCGCEGDRGAFWLTRVDEA